MTDTPTPSWTPVRVWDVPIRVVHWLMVGLIGFSWWTAENGKMDWHRYSGYALLALVSFRICWGLFGSSTARFKQFVRGPRVVWAYLKGQWPVQPGHNPLGALSVIAILELLLLQIMLGLFAVDVDGIESGPLSAHVSFQAGRVAAKLHHLVFNALWVLAVVHIVAVLFYVVFRKQNLITAMVHGKRNYAQDVPAVQNASFVRFVIAIVIAAAATWILTRG